MPDDQAQSILAPVQVDNSVKADAWQAFKDSANEREFGVRLQGMNLPQNVKADLWEAKRKAGSQSPTQALGLPDAAAQAHAVFPQPGTGKTPVVGPQPENQTLTFGSTIPGISGSTVQVPPEVKEQINQQRFKTGLETVGAYAGGEAAAPLVGAAKAAPWILRALAQNAPIGLGVGTGNAIGQGATTGTVNPKESAALAVATTGTGMALQAVPPLAKWIVSSKTAGARLLQQAAAKAGNAPIPISPKTDEIVDEIVKQGKLGGTIPKVITDFLDRVGPSVRQPAGVAPSPLTYEEARILQSNASTPSAQEQMALKGRLKYLIPQFAKSLAEDVQNGANQAGIGAEHAAGMKEYALASSRNRTLVKAGTLAAKGAGVGATAYGAKEIIQNLIKK